MEIIEYVRKSGRKPKRDDDGKIIVVGAGTGRQKKGVLFCAPDPKSQNGVMIGFSLCNKMDEFDYVKGQHEPGFGLDLAKARAEKWSDYSGYFVQNSWTQEDIEDGTDLYSFVNPDPQNVVEIPPSIIQPLRNFIGRCKRYFQDRDFPEWIEQVERSEPEEILEMINHTLEIEWDD